MQVIPLSCTIRCYIGWSGNPDQSCIKGGKEASGISVTTDLHCLHKLSAIENKMMLKITFLLVTLCYVESLEHKTVAVGHYTCWPTSIQDQPIVLEEEGLWKSEANEKAKEAIAEDPVNTICSRTYWFLQGWTIVCSRAPFQSFRCEAGIRSVLWSKEKYYYPRGAWNNRIDEELD